MVVDPVRVGATHCVSIGATNYAGGVTATEHLLSLGHRRIAHAGGPATVECSQARVAGYHSALRPGGVALDDSLITHCEFSYDAGREVAPTCSTEPTDRPRSSRPATRSPSASSRRPGDAPSVSREDLSVIGFDDSFLASRSTPPLTTVAQPLIEMGQLATRSLTQLINDTVVGTRHIELATHLVVRDSTAPPRAPETTIEPDSYGHLLVSNSLPI